MGRKDNPRRQLKNKIIAGSIGVLLLGTGGYELYKRDLTIREQDTLIHDYKQTLVEQGSLIDQQEKDMSNQNKEIKNLQEKVEGLDKKLQKSEEANDKYKKEVSKLEKELAFKKAKAKEAALAAAKESGSKKQTLPSGSESVSGRSVTVQATGYIAMCKEGCTGVTATGINLKSNPNAKVIAVDPNVIPLGSKVYVPGYGYAIAGDTGGAIKGNKIDVHFPDTQTALDWGRRTIQIKIVD